MPWIEPLIGFITDPFSYTFYIERDGCPLSGREIDLLLSQHRIGHHGMYIDPEGDINLNVNKDQAAQAQALFDQHGVVVSNPYKEKPRRGRTTKPNQNRARRGTGADPFSVFDIFD